MSYLVLSHTGALCCSFKSQTTNLCPCFCLVPQNPLEQQPNPSFCLPISIFHVLWDWSALTHTSEPCLWRTHSHFCNFINTSLFSIPHGHKHVILPSRILWISFTYSLSPMDPVTQLRAHILLNVFLTRCPFLRHQQNLTKFGGWDSIDPSWGSFWGSLPWIVLTYSQKMLGIFSCVTENLSTCLKVDVYSSLFIPMCSRNSNNVASILWCPPKGGLTLGRLMMMMIYNSGRSKAQR